MAPSERPILSPRRRAPRALLAGALPLLAAAVLMAGGAVSGGASGASGVAAGAGRTPDAVRAAGAVRPRAEAAGRLDALAGPRTLPGGTGAMDLWLGGDPEIARRFAFHPAPAAGPAAFPRIALVFDDLGYTTEGLARELLEMDVPLTFAVLPGLPRSVAFAEAARAHGHDVLLHLPMEPLDAVRHDPGRDAVRAGLPAAENARRVAAGLAALPRFVGVSNHMGSRVTSSPELVDLVLSEMKRSGRPLFFLDSRTTPFSVVPQRARQAGVSFLRNDLFLDGADESVVWPGVQTGRLESIARRRGQAIAIGHVRPATVAAVREAVERWRAEGIRLVPLSELDRPAPAAIDRPFARR